MLTFLYSPWAWHKKLGNSWLWVALVTVKCLALYLPESRKAKLLQTHKQTHYYLLLKPNVWWSGPRSSCAFCHITRLSLHENQETYRKLMTKENIYYLFSEVESESQRHCLGTGEDSVPPWTRHTPASSLGRTLQLFPNQQLCSVLY